MYAVSARDASATATATREELIGAAARVAKRLAELAAHAREGATWFDPSGQPLGADLYAGLPGVILFLAQYARVADDRRATDLAYAGLSSLQRQLTRSHGTVTTLGGFSGWGGVIYTYTRLAGLLCEPGLLDDAGAIAEDHVLDLVCSDAALDVAGGAAGCIGALLALHRRDPRSASLVVAGVCGERLLATARMLSIGCGWRSIASQRCTPLTGFAHGAAGFAWALFKLAAATGDARFAQAAYAALSYERHQYSAQARNWPDLRFDHVRYKVGWCHGAVGIGLGRLAVLESIDAARVRAEIAAALATTQASGPAATLALCHGELGKLDLMVTAGRVLDEPEWQAEALGRARRMLAAGPLFGPEVAPGLMKGLAGIGYGLLRLADAAEVPSVLTLEA